MWQFALWGLAGAAVNRALVFLEANRRAKGKAWQYPEGPGGGYFAVACVLHCAIGSTITYASALSGLPLSPILAIGMGIGAPAASAKLARIAVAILGDAGNTGGQSGV